MEGLHITEAALKLALRIHAAGQLVVHLITQDGDDDQNQQQSAQQHANGIFGYPFIIFLAFTQ